MSLGDRIKKNRRLFYLIRDVMGLPFKLRMALLHRRGTTKTVVFTSFSGKQYSDNPRAISEKLHKMDPTVNIVWLLNSEAQNVQLIPNYIRCVEYTQKNMIRELARAKVWVDNSFIFAYACNKLYKGKDQLYVQTWHGDRGFKKCGYEWKGFTSDTRGIENGFCDIVLVGSEFEKRFFRNAYRYKGELFLSGSPRDDVLIYRDNDNERLVRKDLGFDDSTNILLYAPTFRDDGNNEGILSFLESIEDILLTCTKYKKGKWVCLCRCHHLGTNFGAYIDNEKCFDVSSFPDMRDLLAISQILITDYSSSAGDFILKHEPVILYQSDRKHFAENDRQLLFDVDKSPYLVAKDIEELIEIIENLEKIDIEKNCDDILAMYETSEFGNASFVVAKRILDYMYEEKLNDY